MSLLTRLIESVVADYAGYRAERALADHENRWPSDAPHPTSVHFGLIEKTISVVVCTFIMAFSALLAWMNIMQFRFNEFSLFALGVSVISAWFCFICYDQFVRRIEWTETHVQFRKWDGAHIRPWSDIVALEEKSYPRCFRIAFRDGTGFSVAETMRGSRYFMRILERRLDPQPPSSGKRRKRRNRGKQR